MAVLTLPDAAQRLALIAYQLDAIAAGCPALTVRELETMQAAWVLINVAQQQVAERIAGLQTKAMTD
jgi:hypothetical protein